MHKWIKVVEYIAPAIAAKLYEKLWFSTRRYEMPTIEKNIKELATVTVLNCPNRFVMYEWGDGDPILLVHGWNGRGTQMAYIIRVLVEQGFRVVAFDAPGHGSSDGNESSLLMYAAAIEAIAKRYHRFHAVVTHSFGGLVAAYCFSQSWFFASRFVAIAPPYSLRMLLDLWRDYTGMRATVYCQLAQRITRRFSRDVLAEMDVERLASKIKIPVLVFHDEDDKDLSIESGRRFAKSIPTAHLVATKGLGHRRILKSKTVVTHIQKYLTTA